jgi:hypothetical protein
MYRLRNAKADRTKQENRQTMWWQENMLQLYLADTRVTDEKEFEEIVVLACMHSLS